MAIVFNYDNRFDGVQFAFQLPEFEIAGPGVIEFDLLVNYAEEPIARALIRFRGT